MQRSFSKLAAAVALMLVALACDEPPPAEPDQIDIDAESRALDENVRELREEADERVATPDADTHP